MTSYDTLIGLGIKPGMSIDEQEEVNSINLGCIITFCFSAISAFLTCLLLPVNYWYVPILFTATYPLTLLYNSLGWRFMAKYNIWAMSLPLFFWLSNVFGEQGNGQFLYMIIILGAVFNFKSTEKWAIFWVLMVPLLLIAIVNYYRFSLIEIPEITAEQKTLMGIFNTLSCFLGVFSSVVYFTLKMKKKSDDLKDSESKLKEQVAILQQTNNELDLLIYSVTHDLRSPLTSSMGLVNLAKQDKANAHTYLDLIEVSLNKMDNFIKDILFYYKNARLEVSVEKMDMGHLVNSIFDAVKLNYPTISLQYEESLQADVIADRLRLEIVLDNLITNAAHYHNRKNPKPYIHVSVVSSQDRIMIEVKDNGEGIRKEIQSKVFQMFFRGNIKAKGSGLGLYIVKEIVNKLEGVITLASEHGVGTTFRVEIPQQSVAQPLPDSQISRTNLVPNLENV